MRTAEEVVLGTVGARVARAIYGWVTKEPPEELIKGALQSGIVGGTTILLIALTKKAIAKGE